MNSNEMQTMETYEAPQVRMIEVEVEKGFALSGGVGGDMDGEGDIH